MLRPVNFDFIDIRAVSKGQSQSDIVSSAHLTPHPADAVRFSSTWCFMARHDTEGTGRREAARIGNRHAKAQMLVHAIAIGDDGWVCGSLPWAFVALPGSF